MTRNILALLLTISMLIGCKQTSSVSVEIVPTSASPKVGKWIEIWWLENRFHVVVSNTSDQQLSVWEQWCSWGWSNLSFQLVTDSGEKVRIERAPGEWSKNFPSHFMLEPGDHFVLPVNLFDGTWESGGISLDPADWPERGQFIAIYTNVPDQYTEKYGVWTGEVYSEPDVYTFDVADTVTNIPR